jgi:hypothetical protein
MLLACVLAGRASAGLVAEAVVASSTTDEVQPAGSIDYLAWTAGPHSRPRRRNVFVRPAGEPKFQVNPAGTVAFTFAGGIDGTRLVYNQQAVSANTGDIKIFNLATRRRSSPPSGVNTRRHECCPHLSGNWLMFERILYSTNTRRIFLFNLATHRRIKIAESTGNDYVQTGSVEGNWAGWVRCPRPAHCQAYRYNIATGHRSKVPNPSNRSQFASSLGTDGTVYFAESRNINCGAGLAIWRHPVGGSRERLHVFPRNRDVAATSPVENLDGSVTVYFDRYSCSTGTSDVYKFTVPAP